MATTALAFGCGAAGDRWRVQLRESERRVAEDNARGWIEHGDWERALASLERAQATPSLATSFAIESTRLKARVLEQLGRHEESLAHLRYLRDHDPATRGQLALDRESTGPPDPLADEGGPPAYEPRPAPELDVPRPRFPKQASWAGVGGVVDVRCRIDAAGEVDEIRVLGPAHPLLASYAIEAIAGAHLRHRDDRALLPAHRTVRFQFAAEPVPASDGTGTDGADRRAAR